MPRFTSSDGVGLHYTDAGEGLPVICLAGLTRNGMDFDYLAPHLPDVRLIRLDYRGRGRSDWADPATYTIFIEARDVLELMDHLGLESAAIIGTSRGGLIAMGLAAYARSRLCGVCLNDVGPVVAPAGLEVIKGYVGRNPTQKTHAEAAAMRAALMSGFAGVPEERWAEEVRKHYVETPEGLTINYDPRLREAVVGDDTDVAPEMWPMFDALQGLPLALIRGANSDVLAPETAERMRAERPDMIYAEVPDRGHIPFLDEPEALDAIRRWLGMMR
ncbi:alpha/beta fold hydrolase [Roseitranquillus sediminis]|uniref:alpha/beta fold hydrolase n=1 Tax=Roseitranquillus sediminis TaxID=2809051 RepID=UPI001D0C6DE6|nr:alpha/beta hydrolase [Roseitranquillus sediminis]MBM9593083.1 alpha/beta hydrolase [Roseitranquillus sediminis]